MVNYFGSIQSSGDPRMPHASNYEQTGRAKSCIRKQWLSYGFQSILLTLLLVPRMIDSPNDFIATFEARDLATTEALKPSLPKTQLHGFNTPVIRY
jgi:hypothetical protein